MRTVGHWLERSINAMAKLLFIIAVALITFVTFLITADVVLRYVFHNPQGWVFELSAMVMAATVFLGIAYVIQKERNIIIEMFTQKLSRRNLDIVDIVAAIITMFALIVLAWKGTDRTVYAFKVHEVTGGAGLPLGPALLTIPLGSIVGLLQLIVVIKNKWFAFLGK
jgi:C4-dicarboxylate transporter, DctQ subunit